MSTANEAFADRAAHRVARAALDYLEPRKQVTPVGGARVRNAYLVALNEALEEYEAAIRALAADADPARVMGEE